MPDLTASPIAVLVTGIPGSGKTTVARTLARRLTRAAHIEVDVLQAMIVAGGLWPDQSPREEAMRQLALRAREKLGGLGLWIDSAGQSPEQTADVIVRGLS